MTDLYRGQFYTGNGPKKRLKGGYKKKLVYRGPDVGTPAPHAPISDTEIQNLIRAEAVRKREYMSSYLKKNKKTLKLYKRQWKKEHTKKLRPFRIHGYYNPETGTISFDNVRVTKRRYKTS